MMCTFDFYGPCTFIFVWIMYFCSYMCGHIYHYLLLKFTLLVRFTLLVSIESFINGVGAKLRRTSCVDNKSVRFCGHQHYQYFTDDIKTSTRFKKVHLNACTKALNGHFKFSRASGNIANRFKTLK